MLENSLLVIITLMFLVSMLAMLGNKLGISYPVFLVLAGLGISLVPGIPQVVVKPDLIFIIFLPPLLYAAAINTSWHEFWANRRPIGLLAFGLVVFTATAVAYFSVWLIPGFTLALGFVLGGIISPPDAIAATSVLEGLKVPKKVMVILEGESLVNDASSLIVFRFALEAVFTGQFSYGKAGSEFLWVALLGILIGVALAIIVYVFHRYLPTTPSIDTSITLITPYLMYIVAEKFHASGVLAVVSGGLFISFRSHKIFLYDSRLQIRNVWQTLTFLLNGLVFILLGLQLPIIVNGLESYSMGSLILYGLGISFVTVVVRFIWIYPATYIPQYFSNKIHKKTGYAQWQSVFLIGWSGMRGVVSLASALSVPLMLDDGHVFPHRNLVLFISFVVILFTLVFQGLSLPFIIKKLNVKIHDNQKQEEFEIRQQLADVALKLMQKNYGELVNNNDLFVRQKARYENIKEMTKPSNSNEMKGEKNAEIEKYHEMILDLIDVRRKKLNEIRGEKKYNDVLIKAKELDLDLEEARMRRLNKAN